MIFFFEIITGINIILTFILSIYNLTIAIVHCKNKIENNNGDLMSIIR